MRETTIIVTFASDVLRLVGKLKNERIIMKNLKVGSKVYHFLNMKKIGTIVAFKKDTKNQVWLTEGSPSATVLAIVEFPDGTQSAIRPGDLFRADQT